MTSPKPMILQHQLSLLRRSLPSRFSWSSPAGPSLLYRRFVQTYPSMAGMTVTSDRTIGLIPPCPPIPSHYPRFVCRCIENMP